jgi:hypothetical protein
MASRPPALALALAGGLGIVLGVATLTVLWALYPAPRGEGWIVVGIGVASLVVVGVVSIVLTRIGAPGVLDSFLIGYVFGLVTVAAIMMANEIVPKLRRRLPVG